MLTNQWLDQVSAAKSCYPRYRANPGLLPKFSLENEKRNPITAVTPKDDKEGTSLSTRRKIFCDDAPQTPDPMAAVRVLKRIRPAGFTLELDGHALKVSPADRLTVAQRAYIGAHKAALVALLQDAAMLHEALVQAGPAGLAWMEGTPGDWDGGRLLAAGEALYSNAVMVSVYGRSYLKAHAPPFAWMDDAEAQKVTP